jgi:predicted nuclease of predicted toxin-antitoxin system
VSIFLANENMPGDAVRAARAAGMDITWMSEIAPGSDDEAVLALALAEQRVLVTFDKDFGEMVFRRGRDGSCGIILLRPRLRSPEYLAQFILNVLSQNVQWEGRFTVAREGNLRTLPLG